jgi:hypothetical protein
MSAILRGSASKTSETPSIGASRESRRARSRSIGCEVPLDRRRYSVSNREP